MAEPVTGATGSSSSSSSFDVINSAFSGVPHQMDTNTSRVESDLAPSGGASSSEDPFLSSDDVDPDLLEPEQPPHTDVVSECVASTVDGFVGGPPQSQPTSSDWSWGPPPLFNPAVLPSRSPSFSPNAYNSWGDMAVEYEERARRAAEEAAEVEQQKKQALEERERLRKE